MLTGSRNPADWERYVGNPEKRFAGFQRRAVEVKCRIVIVQRIGVCRKHQPITKKKRRQYRDREHCKKDEDTTARCRPFFYHVRNMGNHCSKEVMRRPFVKDKPAKLQSANRKFLEYQLPTKIRSRVNYSRAQEA